MEKDRKSGHCGPADLLRFRGRTAAGPADHGPASYVTRWPLQQFRMKNKFSHSVCRIQCMIAISKTSHFFHFKTRTQFKFQVLITLTINLSIC